MFQCHAKILLILLLALFIAACGGGSGGGGGSSPGTGGGGGNPAPAQTVPTYRNTTLPGRMVVNGNPANGGLQHIFDQVMFDLRTGQKVVLPRGTIDPDHLVFNADGNRGTLLRWDADFQQTELSFFDPVSLAATAAALKISSQMTRAPQLSPDGKFILAFWNNSAAGEIITEQKLTIFDASSGAVVKRGSRLNSSSIVHARPAAWLPDGRYVYFVRNSLYVSSPTSADDTLIAQLNLPVNGLDTLTQGDISVSPDGSRLAFNWTEPRDGGIENDSNLWVANVDGTGLRRLTTAPDPNSALDFRHGSPTWSPDGKWVAGILYMSGVVFGLPPGWCCDNDPEAAYPYTVIGGTGCIDQVFVADADGPPIALAWPKAERANGLKVLAPDGKNLQWVTTCGFELISWLP